VKSHSISGLCEANGGMWCSLVVTHGAPPEFSKACLAGATCDQLGQVVERYKKACVQGSSEGCGKLGRSIWLTETRHDGPSASLPFYTKGCRGGYAEACSELAELYLARKDLSQGAQLRAKAFDLGRDAPVRAAGARV
jgi:hypothetical protein